MKTTTKVKKQTSVKQVASIEDTETIVRIDYERRKVCVYSNRATVINRMDKAGYKAVDVTYSDGKIYSKSYELPTTKITEILKGTLFKYN